MGAPELLVPLDGTMSLATRDVGGKAARLNELAAGGFRVPRGFCLKTAAYTSFLEENGLQPVLRAELGRKALATMRWEEMWDAGLRLRSVFLSHAVPGTVRTALSEALGALGSEVRLVVRSSAPGEDAGAASFAGLHESVVDVSGEASLFDAVRVVWASLWSDAALLYFAELGMDPSASRMAVVVQEQVEADRSGVAFGLDPLARNEERQVVEAVPGPCGGLVDGVVDPDRWVLDRTTGAVLTWRVGEREGSLSTDALLAPADLLRLHEALLSVERLCGWPPDLEWTGRGRDFHLLQARPVTLAARDDDDRRWYLGLRPGLRRLRQLRRVVAEERIPALKAEGERLARVDLSVLDDRTLADAIDERVETLGRWRGLYRDEFIPFAHGLRTLGTYYNDLVRPDDPFEFVGLVRGEDLQALRRNERLAELASRLRADAPLWDSLESAVNAGRPVELDRLRATPTGEGFLRAFDELRSEFFDLEYAGERLCDRPDAILRHLLELARSREREAADPERLENPGSREERERRLFAAAGPKRAEETAEMLAVGRLSWRLRDDDNLLLGRVESQLLRALEEAHRRLAPAGRVQGGTQVGESCATSLSEALRDPSRTRVVSLPDAPLSASDSEGSSTRPRQLVGQPASPGLATGPACRVRNADDIGRFQGGAVLVCDAIQPNMTHLVPLASGIVERRGGMLIHGAIIARELGIPCVNGVSRAIEDVPDGETVTVDGDLGIVTVGAPEFRLEGVDPS